MSLTILTCLSFPQPRNISDDEDDITDTKFASAKSSPPPRRRSNKEDDEDDDEGGDVAYPGGKHTDSQVRWNCLLACYSPRFFPLPIRLFILFFQLTIIFLFSFFILFFIHQVFKSNVVQYIYFQEYSFLFFLPFNFVMHLLLFVAKQELIKIYNAWFFFFCLEDFDSFRFLSSYC